MDRGRCEVGWLYRDGVCVVSLMGWGRVVVGMWDQYDVRSFMGWVFRVGK
jgi:hypothetical protein